ncbi:hypothetical protein KC19_10G052000 [Ceratodon purpureus]|uniref:Uncharacterized protein n=1 Tax=Ceratodon purpureus TaxID=3225 RepID=A0A8T0GLZ2_CERPU|nr:hypothetical protein KC19_10G052000 [Ceratodon purpureus]
MVSRIFKLCYDASKWLREDRVQHIQPAPDRITPHLNTSILKSNLIIRKNSLRFPFSRIQQDPFNWERRDEKENLCDNPSSMALIPFSATSMNAKRPGIRLSHPSMPKRLAA